MLRNLIQPDQTTGYYLSTLRELICIYDPIKSPLSLYQIKKLLLQKLEIKQFLIYLTKKLVNLLAFRSKSFKEDIQMINEFFFTTSSYHYQESYTYHLLLTLSLLPLLQINSEEDAFFKLERLDENFHILFSNIQQVIQNRNFNFGIIDRNSETFKIMCLILDTCKRPIPFISKLNITYQIQDLLTDLEGQYLEDGQKNKSLSDIEDFDIYEDIFSNLAFPQEVESWIFNKEDLLRIHDVLSSQGTQP